MGSPENTPKYGFVIDQRKCIGCHACTVACKSENEVPLGNFRTWVKYVDKGTYPAVRRHFTVLRCNHCDDAPCVTICPVNALHKRPDAIVDLDRDACIGCRGCMQACPYDALYLNEDTGTAEKCHYCAHRTERGLEPACVVVCPEQAIVAGDASDPETPISKLIAGEGVSQRKLEKGTKPRVWYVDALPEALEPDKTTEPNDWLWANRRIQPPAVPPELAPPTDIVTTLNAEHPPVWGWHIWWYLMTKNVAAGVMIVAPLLALLGVSSVGVLPEILGLVFLGVTMFLLIHDLGRPERFLKILLTPNTQSWLVKGGWVLTAFGALTAAALVARLAGEDGIADVLRWVNLPVAILTSGYSAFLFAQCRGRDLWHSKSLFWDLTVRAVVIGLGFAACLPGDLDRLWTPDLLFVVFTVIAGVLVFSESRFLPDTDHAKRAHALMLSTYDPWNLSILLLMVAVPFALLAPMAALALVLGGFFVRERAWVRAGQAVPIS